MKEGDLVNVYAITNKGKQGPVYTGIYMGWDRSDMVVMRKNPYKTIRIRS